MHKKILGLDWRRLRRNIDLRAPVPQPGGHPGCSGRRTVLLYPGFPSDTPQSTVWTQLVLRRLRVETHDPAATHMSPYSRSFAEARHHLYHATYLARDLVRSAGT